MKATLTVAALIVMTAMAGPLSALAGDTNADPGAADTDGAEQIAKGHDLYQRLCSHCHGLNMVTAGNATYDLRQFPRDQRERFFESVTNGRNGRMPPWGDHITQEEIGEIWAYIRTGGK
jgi:mono/diheme cytochrome c family protein